MSVYFGQREDGLIKIGCSRNVAERLRSLKAKMIGVVDGGFETESTLHARFAHLREQGEWFRPGDDLLEYIQSEAQGNEPDSNDFTQTAFRLRKSWLARIDKIAERMSTPSMDIGRADAIRAAIHQWMEAEEKAVSKKR